jgi:transposase
LFLSRAGRKLHVVVDGRGLPARVLLTTSQASDKTTTPTQLAGLELLGDVVADRAIERFLKKFECFRRFATRFGKLPRNVFAAMLLAPIGP